MLIHLVGSTPELYRLCHDILSETPEAGHGWKLEASAPEASRADADVCIWDVHPDAPLPQNGECKPLKHIFLVDPKDREAVEGRVGAEASLVLKPVRQRVLANLLAAAVSAGSARRWREDRDQLLQCLIEANLKIQEHDRERATFLARAMHDLRAPLTALSGYCGLLLSEPLGPLNADQGEILRRMQNSAERLSRMASAMFDLGTGRLRRTPELQPGDLRECVQQALLKTAAFADEKALSIRTELAECGEDVYFDNGQIEQVLMNILDHAYRFAPRAGSIEIRGNPYFWERRSRRSAPRPPVERRTRMSREPNSYRVDISDTGALLPAQFPENVFDENPPSGGAERSGGGLAMAICKIIITQHGGRIWAENREGGAVFSFILPAYKSDLAAARHVTTGDGRGSRNGT